MKDEVEESYGFHLSVIKEHLCEVKSIVAGPLCRDERRVIEAPLNYKNLMFE